MSPFDLSFLSVPPEGGTDALAGGVPTSPKDEAPSDAFSQLLAQLSSVSQEDVTMAASSEAIVEDLELATKALSTSPDGWEETQREPGSASVGTDADESAASPLVLTGFLMALPVPKEAARRSNVNQSIDGTNSVEEPPVARGVSDRLTEVLAKNPPDVKASEAIQLAHAETTESIQQLAAGKTSAASSSEVSLSNVNLPQFEDSVPKAEDKVQQLAASAVDKAANDNVRKSVADDVSRGGRSEAPAAAARNRNSAEDSTRLVNALTVNMPEIAASLERRAASQGEPQPDLTPGTRAVSTGSGGQPQQVVQTFQQAVAAALHAASTSAVPTTPPSDPGGLDNQIVQGIRRLWRDGSEEIRVTLRPEYLGALTISLKVDQNVVRAVLHVDEPQVRAWVQAHEAQLRQAMASQGLSLEQLVVTDERPGKENRGRDAEARQNRRPTPRPTSADPTPVFEVAV